MQGKGVREVENGGEGILILISPHPLAPPLAPSLAPSLALPLASLWFKLRFWKAYSYFPDDIQTIPAPCLWSAQAPGHNIPANDTAGKLTAHECEAFDC